MRYASAEAFRSALDQRLKNQAAETGTAPARLRKSVAFDRFLARLAQVASGRWVLKGALALDFRLGSATRTTKDIDLGRLDDEQAATEDFFAAQALDLGDFFTFAVQRTPALDAAAGFSAVRYRVQAELAGRRFEEFPGRRLLRPPRLAAGLPGRHQTARVRRHRANRAAGTPDRARTSTRCRSPRCARTGCSPT